MLQISTKFAARFLKHK